MRCTEESLRTKGKWRTKVKDLKGKPQRTRGCTLVQFPKIREGISGEKSDLRKCEEGHSQKRGRKE